MPSDGTTGVPSQPCCVIVPRPDPRNVQPRTRAATDVRRAACRSVNGPTRWRASSNDPDLVISSACSGTGCGASSPASAEGEALRRGAQHDPRSTTGRRCRRGPRSAVLVRWQGPSRPLLCPIRACFSGLCLPRRDATSPHAPRGQPSKRPGTSVERPEIRSSCWVSQVCIASTSGRLRC
jgi:hypothetical protein